MNDTLRAALLEYLLPIGFAYLLAWMAHRLAPRLVATSDALSGLLPEGLRAGAERRRTLDGLMASLVGVLAYLTATVFALGRFIDATTLIWMIGLFSAAFGLGARPLIADFLTGFTFMAEDIVHVGEKVEIMNIQGVVQNINLRTTIIRAPSGELYAIPNGEVRVIRNFSRGQFSSAEITIRLAAADLPAALELLRKLGETAADAFPDLVEPWQIINVSGVLAQQVELTLLIKAQYGRAADLRLALLVFLQKHLAEAEVALA